MRAFLIDEHHILVIKKASALQIFKLNPAANTSDTCQLLTETTEKGAICELRLPELKPHFRFDLFSLSGTRCGYPHPDCEPLFSPDPTLLIIALHLQIEGIIVYRGGERTLPCSSHLLLVPTSTLLSYASKAGATKPNDLNAPLSISWDEWGPTGTRWIQKQPNAKYVSLETYGARVGMGFAHPQDVVPKDQVAKTYDLVILDTHPGAHRPLDGRDNTPALDGSEAPSSCDLADSTTDPAAFRWIVPHSKLAEQTPEFEHPWRPGKFPCWISYKRLQCDRPIWHGEVVLTASAVGVKVREFEPGTAGC